MLLLGQLIKDITHLMIAAPLHRLIAAEHLLDGRTQCLGPIHDEQVFALGRQADLAGESASA